jgi:hypothetical protein
MGLGNFSRLSPPIGINEDGFRNGPIDWQGATVLAVGSSELLGPGVEDDEVWTALATEALTRRFAQPVTVVNAGSSGYGPYHHAMTVRRFLETHGRPKAIVVRASVSDRRFGRPTSAELEAARRQKVYSRAVKAVSEFLPFLVNKVQAQVLAVRRTFRPDPPAAQEAPAHEMPEVADQMMEANGVWWTEIVSLGRENCVPILFYVDAGDGSPSALRLAELLTDRFGTEPGVQIAVFDIRATGMDAVPQSLRRQRFASEYTLGDDPHGNAALHAREASFLTPLIAQLLTHQDKLTQRVGGPVPCAPPAAEQASSR